MFPKYDTPVYDWQVTDCHHVTDCCLQSSMKLFSRYCHHTAAAAAAAAAGSSVHLLHLISADRQVSSRALTYLLLLTMLYAQTHLSAYLTH